MYVQELRADDWFANYVNTYVERDVRQLLAVRDLTQFQRFLRMCAARSGQLFESFVVSEFIKQRYNAGRPAELTFWRDNVGHEIDLLYETPEGLQAVEIKSGATFASDWLQGPDKWLWFAGNNALPPLLVFGGSGAWQRGQCKVMGWRELA